jgi:hypothetical protein
MDDDVEFHIITHFPSSTINHFSWTTQTPCLFGDAQPLAHQPSTNSLARLKHFTELVNSFPSAHRSSMILLETKNTSTNLTDQTIDDFPCPTSILGKNLINLQSI